ncbi:MAG: HAMP domain-containing histidine kinase, partial [Oscillospiraceae bacterium]|nr:HAMP domain-containing histidine kinase [Oscillospiraceae bacterium]
THRLSRLVRNMLDVSQLSAKEPTELRKSSFDLTEVVVQTLLSLEKKITDRKLDVDAEIPEEPIVTLGDRDSITQVVYNLLDNAAKFAAEGSVIKLSVYKRSGRAYVSVENRGETIPEKELPLIFDRFHKTDKSRNFDKDGVGLGLYIVKTILDNHREDIFVTSANGVTKFTFTLTIAPQK